MVMGSETAFNLRSSCSRAEAQRAPPRELSPLLPQGGPAAPPLGPSSSGEHCCSARLSASP